MRVGADFYLIEFLFNLHSLLLYNERQESEASEENLLTQHESFRYYCPDIGRSEEEGLSVVIEKQTRISVNGGRRSEWMRKSFVKLRLSFILPKHRAATQRNLLYYECRHSSRRKIASQPIIIYYKI